MTECNAREFDFQALGIRDVTARFDGGAITSDAGGLLLRDVEVKAGIIRRFAACLVVVPGGKLRSDQHARSFMLPHGDPHQSLSLISGAIFFSGQRGSKRISVRWNLRKRSKITVDSRHVSAQPYICWD